jgi:hypothetical protein
MAGTFAIMIVFYKNRLPVKEYGGEEPEPVFHMENTHSGDLYKLIINQPIRG